MPGRLWRQSRQLSDRVRRGRRGQHGLLAGLAAGHALRAALVATELGSPVLEPDLYACLAEVHPGGQLFAGEGIRVVAAFERLLQGAQLLGAECGAAAASGVGRAALGRLRLTVTPAGRCGRGNGRRPLTEESARTRQQARTDRRRGWRQRFNHDTVECCQPFCSLSLNTFVD